MYISWPGLTLGFHGCDKWLCDAVLSGQTELKKSVNNYDWLGSGIHFWANDPDRALDYADGLKANPPKPSSKINEPDVLGAVLDLGFCLDLTKILNIQELKIGYEILQRSGDYSGQKLPTNRNALKNDNDVLIRELDCAVIQTIHKFRQEVGLRPYDSIVSGFFEGEEVYPNAGFKTKNHLQICIINPNCIKGYFRLREESVDYPSVP